MGGCARHTCRHRKTSPEDSYSPGPADAAAAGRLVGGRVFGRQLGGHRVGD
jgi:hypothetical protein